MNSLRKQPPESLPQTYFIPTFNLKMGSDHQLHEEVKPPFACQSCRDCLVRNFSLFDSLNHDELAVIDKHRTTVDYKAGEFIFKEGTRPFGLLCLSSGKVKISVTGNTGTELIVALKKPVDFLGFADLIAGKSHATSAHVLEEASVCVVPKDDFFAVAENNSDLLRKMNLYFIDDLGRAHERMAGLTQKHMRARLADALLFVHRVYGENSRDRSLDVPLKRSDIGALSNMTTANAIRTLSDFMQEGLIKVDKRRVSILQMSQLQSISLQG